MSLQESEPCLQKSELQVYKSQNSKFTRVRTVFTKVGILSLKQDSEKKSELWKSKSELILILFHTFGQEGLLFLFFF